MNPRMKPFGFKAKSECAESIHNSNKDDFSSFNTNIMYCTLCIISVSDKAGKHFLLIAILFLCLAAGLLLRLESLFDWLRAF